MILPIYIFLIYISFIFCSKMLRLIVNYHHFLAKLFKYHWYYLGMKWSRWSSRSFLSKRTLQRTHLNGLSELCLALQVFKCRSTDAFKNRNTISLRYRYIYRQIEDKRGRERKRKKIIKS